MRDSMHILDQLRERGYEPQDEAREGEGWFDRRYPDAALRVVLSDDELVLFAFDRYMCVTWDASFRDGTPAAVILAALDAAEREAGEEDGYRAAQLAHEHHYAGQTLRHTHKRGDRPHGYYEHPEDTPLHEHDDYAPHSREVGADHGGVSRQS